MRIKFYPLKKLQDEILSIIGSRLDVKQYSVFFFGSRVMGKGDERSDIDVGILGPQEIPLEVLSSIREKVNDLPTLYSIDVVDFHRVTEEFKKVALQKIEHLC